MISVFNTNRERSVVHTIKGADGKPVHLRLLPNKLTQIPDEVLPDIRRNLTESQNAELIVGDEEISKARASQAALLNAEKARADGLASENEALKKQIEQLQKLSEGKKGRAA